MAKLNHTINMFWQLYSNIIIISFFYMKLFTGVWLIGGIAALYTTWDG